MLTTLPIPTASSESRPRRRRRTHLPTSAAVAAMAAALLAGPPASDAGPEQAPRRPPEPFPVFIEIASDDDPERAAALAEAEELVRERVLERRDWFRAAASEDEAALVLRIVNARSDVQHVPHIERQVFRGQVTLVERSRLQESFYVDALAMAGDVRERITGADERERGTSLRNAARDLAEKLEDWCRANYATLAPEGSRGSEGS